MILALGGSTFAQGINEGSIWSLQRCIDYALQNNLNLQQASLNVDRSQSSLDLARRQTLPNLNANAGGNLSDGFVIDPSTNTPVQLLVFSSNFGISSGVTAYAGGQIKNGITQSELDLKASSLDLEASQNDITLFVVQGYTNILLQNELVQSAETQLSSTKERRERTNKLVNAGAAAPAALLDIESQIATEELAVVNARNQVELAHMTLMQLLRLPLDRPFGIDQPDLPKPDNNASPLKPTEVFSIAEQNQPVIRAADMRIQSADYGIKVAQGGGRPRLTFSAGINSVFSSAARDVVQTGTALVTDSLLVNNIKVGITTEQPVVARQPISFFNQLGQQFNWGVGANLSIPIFNRGQVVNNVEQARIAKKQAEIQADIQRQNLEQLIQQASFDVKSSFAQYEATIKQVEALETAFYNAEKQFNLGVINSVDYLVAKNNLNRANNDLIRNKYDFIFKSKILDFYAGREIKL